MVDNFKYIGSSILSNGGCGGIEVKQMMQAGWSCVEESVCDIRTSVKQNGGLQDCGETSYVVWTDSGNGKKVVELKMLKFSLYWE